MAIVFLLLGLIVFAAIGVPLAFSIGASCITYLSAVRPMFLSMMTVLIIYAIGVYMVPPMIAARCPFFTERVMSFRAASAAPS